MKLTERDVTTAAYRTGAVFVLSYIMYMAGRIGTELGVGEGGSLVANMALYGFVAMVFAALWPFASNSFRQLKNVLNHYRSSA